MFDYELVIDGYELDIFKLLINGMGIFDYVLLFVMYVYKKMEGVFVIVKYVDENGNEIIIFDILIGKLDDFYYVKVKEIIGFILDNSKLLVNVSGVFEINL